MGARRTDRLRCLCASAGWYALARLRFPPLNSIAVDVMRLSVGRGGISVGSVPAIWHD